MSFRREINPEYVYITIPAEYVCVYHKLLAMLSDYGEEMLKDCKASCTSRNSGIIECYNMFNAAVAARTLGETKKAETIIKYVKAKINQIYKGNNNDTGYVFPVDENGKLKAFVSCNDRPRFFVDDDELYKQDQGLGYEEGYSLDDENNPDYINPFDFTCEAEVIDRKIVASVNYTFNKLPLREDVVDTIQTEYYVNQKYVPNLDEYTIEDNITVSLRVVAYYNGYSNNHTYALEIK